MAVEASNQKKKSREGERGQSLLEFLMMIPMMFGITVLLVRVNSAIQVSIVDQQYARAQATWVAFNSPNFPRMSLRVRELDQKGYSQMTIGISDNQAPTSDSSGGPTYVPKATVVNVARKKNGGGSNADQEEPSARTQVRVRNTVTICTQVTNNVGNSGTKPTLPLPQADPFTPTGPWNLPSNGQFQFCKGPSA
jgi:hypothetical protein